MPEHPAMAVHRSHPSIAPTSRHYREGMCAIVMFVRALGPAADRDLTTCQLPAHAVALLGDWGFRLVLVSDAPADRLRDVQREFDVHEPFICGGGAALHVPSYYFGDVVAALPRADGKSSISTLRTELRQ
jgi:hypothetical protein